MLEKEALLLTGADKRMGWDVSVVYIYFHPEDTVIWM